MTSFGLGLTPSSHAEVEGLLLDHLHVRLLLVHLIKDGCNVWLELCGIAGL